MQFKGLFVELREICREMLIARESFFCPPLQGPVIVTMASLAVNTFISRVSAVDSLSGPSRATFQD
jgi:hypothetical protein